MQLLAQIVLIATFLASLALSFPQIPVNGGGGGVNGNCNFFCCEFNPGTGGTLCRNNTIVPPATDYPYFGNCTKMPIGNHPNGDGKATPVCCTNPNCATQAGWPQPVLNQ